MAQAKTLDTAQLRAHDPEHRASLTIGAVAVVDGAVPSYEAFKNLLARRIRSIPRCTQLLRTPELEWADCPEFDVTRHLRRTTVSRPGGEAELFRAVARALERPLDLSRPPWECWVIDGMQGGRWAIVMKIHPCLADGSPAAELLTGLCDDADAVAVDVERVSLPHGERPGRAAALGTAEWASKLAGALVGAVLPRPTVGSVIPRRYGSVRVAIADVDTVCRKFGVTVNDVALAAITEGFRTVLLGRGEQPRADSLRSLVPLAGRSAHSAMLSYLPVEHEDPIQRLRTVQRRWRVTPSDRPNPGGTVGAAMNILPTPLRDGLFQLLSRLPQHGIVTLATDASRPRHQLRLMGRTMERLLPIPPTAARLNSGVAVLNYGDDLVFGITAGHGAQHDVKQLAAGIELGVARLVALSQDSVLIFGKEHRRKCAARRSPQRWHPSGWGQARH